jgi:hypothetical protein
MLGKIGFLGYTLNEFISSGLHAKSQQKIIKNYPN